MWRCTITSNPDQTKLEYWQIMKKNTLRIVVRVYLFLEQVEGAHCSRQKQLHPRKKLTLQLLLFP